MNRKELIYVENISPTSSEQNLQSYLERFAPVQAVYFLREKQCTKRSIAAFVRVVNATDRDIIMQKNQQNYRGKRLFMLLADQQNDYKAEHTVIVRNITTKISEEILYEHFETCGKISFLQIRTDDFAYVAFEDKASVRNAMSKNNQPLKGSSLKIQVLTRNLDIMIVNLDTLASRMPDLHRKMVLPVEPRAPTTAQQQQQPAAQPQSTAVVQPQQQSQPTQQRQQPPQSFAQNQQQQPHPSRHQQQLQQQLLQQRENQLRKQQQQAEQQRVQQAEQQRLQQQQQMLQQQKPLPQRQQNQQQSQARSEDLEQQQQKLQSQIQMLKEKANVLAGKQQQHQQQQQQQQSKSAPAVRQQPMQQEAVASTSAAVTVPSDTDDVQIVEVMETQEIIEDDDDDMDVQIVDKPLVEPTPSEYKPKPDDIMRPVKASEMVLKAVPTLKSEDDRRCVWVNNIQPETRRIDLVRYMEQFGDVVLCKVGNSNNCAFTRWAKVMFTSVDAAERAAEYFLHPFQGRYLFVLQCSKFVVEEPGKVFAIDYLSKYLVYEDVVKAFKHIGEVVYLVRLYDNNYKVRIFFLDKVVEKDVLAVDSIGGHAVTMEPYIENMPLKLAKPLAKELKEAREVLNPEKEARLAKVVEIYKQEALDRYATRDYTNPDPKTSPVEVVVYNVPKSTTETQIRRFFKSIGEPTAIRREPNEPHPVCEIDRVYVGFRTLSMAMEAAEIPPERTLNSYNPFIFTAWTQPAMTDRNTLRLFFSKYISIQNIYNGLIHCGPIKYIEKQVAKRALVVFGNGQAGVENAKQQNFIGDNKITGKDKFSSTADSPPELAVENLETAEIPKPAENPPAETEPTANEPTVDLWRPPVDEKIEEPIPVNSYQLKIGTWNVAGCSNPADRAIVDQFLHSHSIAVACLQETRMPTCRDSTEHYIWFNVNRANAMKGSSGGTALVVRKDQMSECQFTQVSDSICSAKIRIFQKLTTVFSVYASTSGINGEVPDPVFSALGEVITAMRPRSRSNFIVLGDFNAQIGFQDMPTGIRHLIGKNLFHPYTNANGEGVKLILQTFGLKLCSSFGPCKSVQCTWKQGDQQAQTAHIIMPVIEQFNRPKCCCEEGVKGFSDHCMLVLTARYRPTQLRTQPQPGGAKGSAMNGNAKRAGCDSSQTDVPETNGKRPCLQSYYDFSPYQ